ncbi:MAG: FHA domain-containing protein [Phycisphaeraceae bacterium]|nr:FHA domain-containing protein [Phycisphaeraceae bacterium]
MNLSLVMFKSDGARRDFAIEKARIVIGRTNNCDLRIPLSSVSRQHCEVRVEGDKAILRDLGSSNGTYHNSVRIQEVVLRPGDEISVGSVVFFVTIDGQPENLQPVRSSGGETAPVAREEAPTPYAKAPAVEEDDDQPVELPELDEEESTAPLALADDDEEETPSLVAPVQPEPVKAAAPPAPTPAPAKPQEIETPAEEEELVLPDSFEEESHTSSIELDDPIAALQAMADRESEDSGEIPLLEDDEDKN